jgi:hypothetical protein
LITKDDDQSGFETAVLIARSLLSAGDFRVAQNQGNAVASLPTGGLKCDVG